MFLAHGIDAFVPHDLRRPAHSLRRLGLSPLFGERAINHSKDVREEMSDLWNYFDEKRDAPERLENYLLELRGNKEAGVTGEAKQAPRTRRRKPNCATASGNGPMVTLHATFVQRVVYRRQTRAFVMRGT
jgi:hypothetical protein